MKIRTSHVSNSSSSSFVVAFPEHPKTTRHMKKMLFPTGQEAFLNPYYTSDPDWRGEYETESWPTDTVAQIVYRDFSGYKGYTRQQLVTLATQGWLDGQPDYEWRSGLSKEEREDVWNEYKEKCREYAEKVVDEFLQHVDGDTTIAIFEYSDNDGALFSAMEHGDLFRHLPHIRISHH